MATFHPVYTNIRKQETGLPFAAPGPFFATFMHRVSTQQFHLPITSVANGLFWTYGHSVAGHYRFSIQ